MPVFWKLLSEHLLISAIYCGHLHGRYHQYGCLYGGFWRIPLDITKVPGTVLKSYADGSVLTPVLYALAMTGRVRSRQ